MKIQTLKYFFIGMLISGVAIADEDGWNDALKKHMAKGCVAGIVTPAKRDFNARARQSGDETAVFPEGRIKSSASDLCACIIQRSSHKWSYQQIQRQPQLMNKLISEAMAGGECRPSGILGKLMGVN